MLRLKLERSPQTVELGRGMSVTIRPITAIDREAARIAAERRGFDPVAAYELLKALDAPYLVLDEKRRPGFVSILSLAELAKLCVESVAGFRDRDGGELTAEDLSVEDWAYAFQDEVLRRMFDAAAASASAMLIQEGEGSPLSGNGSPARAADGARNADDMASHVPSAGADETASSAPNTSTSPEPTKALPH